MKKLLSLILITILMVATFSFNTFADTGEDEIPTETLYYIDNGEVTIRFLTSAEIPTEIEGYPVTAIGYKSISYGDHDPTFVGHRVGTKIVIPEGIKIIEAGAFKFCKKLADITLPDTIEYIGYDAFEDTAYFNDSSNWEDGVLYIGKHLIKADENLSGEYKIKEGTLTIAEDAFDNCKKLTGITIPSSVKNLCCIPFDGCNALKNITIATKNKFFSAKDGVIYTKDMTEVLAVINTISGELILPNGVTTFSDAFNNCKNLTAITIPKSVKNLSSTAFKGCKSLKSITIADDNPYLTINNGIIYNKRLTELITASPNIVSGNITLPKTVKIIHDNALSNCKHITSVKLPNGVEKIGYKAFYHCASLKNINLPDTITDIGEYAFAGCSLTEIKLSKNLKIIKESSFEGNKLKEIIIPEGVTEIDMWAFCDSNELTKLTLPKSIKSIKSGAFRHCPNLQKVHYNGTEKEAEKIKITGKRYGNNHILSSAYWTYAVSSTEKPVTSKDESTASKVENETESIVSSEPENTVSTDNESTVSTDTESTISPENETEKNDMKKPDVKPKNNTVTVLVLIGSILLCIAGGFSAFFIYNKKRK